MNPTAPRSSGVDAAKDAARSLKDKAKDAVPRFRPVTRDEEERDDLRKLVLAAGTAVAAAGVGAVSWAVNEIVKDRRGRRLP